MNPTVVSDTSDIRCSLRSFLPNHCKRLYYLSEIYENITQPFTDDIIHSTYSIFIKNKFDYDITNVLLCDLCDAGILKEIKDTSIWSDVRLFAGPYYKERPNHAYTATLQLLWFNFLCSKCL
jgi:hypothetical protein